LRLTLVAVGAALLATSVTAWAGRVARGNDPGFELCRIVSAYQGKTSETIGPVEQRPNQPIQGETFLIGTSTIFPEGAKVETFRSAQGWRVLQPTDYTFSQTVITPEGSTGALTSVVIRFAADKVALIQNAFVRITILPMPGPQPTGDTVEGVFLRAP
jgi:hypothetical protein